MISVAPLASLLFLTLALFSLNLLAQQNEDSDTQAGAPAKAAADKGKPEAAKEKPASMKEEPPVVTHHQISVNGRVLKYTATTGYMPLRNSETDEVEAKIFFVAYTLDNPSGQAPADVLVQWRTGFGVDLAAPGSARTSPGEDAARWRNASTAV